MVLQLILFRINITIYTITVDTLTVDTLAVDTLIVSYLIFYFYLGTRTCRLQKT
jgi:hypothetical protein